jgi:ethanolamine utilization protein EutQ (cupin superfamily)
MNFRIVKNQNSKNILAAFDQWLQTTLPEYLNYELDI